MGKVFSRSDRIRKIATTQTGTRYEKLARAYLEKAGLIFVAANIGYRLGELDLIMRDGSAWVFVEVRYRRNNLFGSAADSITYSKRRRLLLAAECWLQTQSLSLDNVLCRFDVLAVTGSQLQWIQNAFGNDGEIT